MIANLNWQLTSATRTAGPKGTLAQSTTANARAAIPAAVSVTLTSQLRPGRISGKSRDAAKSASCGNQQACQP